jgi:hypothetical protein
MDFQKKMQLCSIREMTVSATKDLAISLPKIS